MILTITFEYDNDADRIVTIDVDLPDTVHPGEYREAFIGLVRDAMTGTGLRGLNACADFTVNR